MTNKKLFFEFTEPYYALIAASDQKEAAKTYREYVCDGELSWTLISKDGAYDKFLEAVLIEIDSGETTYSGPDAVKEEFEDSIQSLEGLLLVDVSFL